MFSTMIKLLFLFCLSWGNIVRGKTFEVDGDTIDCVNINQQPSLAHPLLKNHKVQMRPTSYPIGIGESSDVIKEGGCPLGSVPIYKTRNDELRQSKILINKFFNNVNYIDSDYPNNARFVYLKLKESPYLAYHGAFGIVSVYNFTLQQDQMSSTNIWIESTQGGQRNLITAGYTISPALNGDNRPRLSVFWMGNDGAGCYNKLCKGFVQVDRVIGPQTPLVGASKFGGPTYEYNISIWEDQETKNWWLSIQNPDVIVGYWPKELFSHLNTKLNSVKWGGVAIGGRDGISPPIGSGHKPDGNYLHAAYFRSIHFVNDNGHLQAPHLGNVMEEVVDCPAGYGLQNDKYGRSRPRDWGYVFSFGGPGGSCPK